MDKEQFWRIIDSARETAGEWKKMYEPLLETLSALDEQDIIRWDQIFDEYRNLAYKDKLWGAAALMNEGCSKDDFEYFIGWLISQGKATYLKILEDPDSLSGLETVRAFGHDRYGESVSFESVLSAAFEAHGIRTGQDDGYFVRYDESPLPENEKTELAGEGEVVYAEAIDADWWSRGGSWSDVSKKLCELLPKLYKLFNETEPPKKKAKKASKRPGK